MEVKFIFPGLEAQHPHPDEIHAAVAEALRDDPQRRARARQYRDYLFFGLDGQASQRTKAIIERLLAEGGHANCA